MKLTYSLLIVSLFLSCSKSSEDPIPVVEIPNADFENWGILDDFEKPISWGTSNFSLFGVYTFNTVTKDGIEKYSGNFCPKLETKSQIINDTEVKVAGLITLGSFDINIATRKAGVSGGVPFISKPVSLDGYYKYNGVGIDSCIITIALTKFNSQLNTKDTIGLGLFASSSRASWTSFSIPIEYLSSVTPDSMNVVIMSSDIRIFEVGSTLWVDNLELIY